jgi:RecB family exonuclease
VSFHQLDLFQKCPRLYQQKYIERRRPERQVLWPWDVTGRVLHDTLADCFRQLPPHQRTAENLEQILRRRWRDFDGHDLAFKDRDHERVAGLEAIRALQWFASEPELVKEPLHFEYSCAAPVDEAVELQGRIDRIDEAPDGGLVISDYKSGQPKSGRFYEELRPQLMVYAFLASEALQRPIARVRFVYLEAHVMQEETPTPLEIANVRQVVRDAVIRIDSELDFDPTPSPLCRYCDFLPDCGPGRAFMLTQPPAD